MSQQQVSYPKPLPLMRGAVKEFYDWCKRHKLRFVRCQSCGTWRHPPRPMCDKCGSLAWEWAKSSGKGKVYTWTVTYQPLHPGFAGDVPYAGVIVELEEGPRIVTWVSDVNPEDLTIGLPVEVWFDAVTPEVTLPKCKRAS